MPVSEKLGYVWRNSKTEILLWPAAIGATGLFVLLNALIAHFGFPNLLPTFSPAEDQALQEKWLSKSFWFGALIVAPIIENAILVMLAYMLSSHIKRPLHLAVVTGVLSGLAHWTANGAINGLYSCVFFYLMARIYLRLLDIRKGWCGYGLTTAMHAVNNFFVFGLAAIISRFW